MNLRDPEEYQQAYRAHVRRVYANAYRILRDPAKAEDTVQDVFLRLWLRPDRFDPARGDLGGYLSLMARSRALDIARSEQAAARATDRLETATASESRVPERPDELAEGRESAARIRAAVAELPRAQREAVALAFWAGMPAGEIARRTGVPLGTARSRLRLGLEKLERSAVAERLERDTVIGLPHPQLVRGAAA